MSKYTNMYHPETNWIQVMSWRSIKEGSFFLNLYSSNVTVLFRKTLVDHFGTKKSMNLGLLCKLVTMQNVVIGTHTNHMVGEPLLQPIKETKQKVRKLSYKNKFI